MKINKEEILKSAVKLAEKTGLEQINFDKVSQDLNVSRSILYRYFISTNDLKQAVLDYAIINDNIVILIEALIFNKFGLDKLSKRQHSDILKFFN